MYAFSWADISIHFDAVRILAAILAMILMGIYFFKVLRNASRVPMNGLHDDASGTAEGKRDNRLGRYIQPADANEEALNWNRDKVDPRQNASSPPSDEREKTVLVADDDPVVVLALSQRLKRLGFHVVHSPDAAHALMGAIKIMPDLIIMDVKMPSGNGLAAAEMMASDPRYQNIPVIIHSVLDDEPTRDRCKNLGLRYVEKSPKSWSQIKSIVETLFGIIEEESKMQEASAAKTDNHAAESELPAFGHLPANRPTDDLPAAETEKTPSLEKSTLPISGAYVPVCGHARLICIDSNEGELDLFETRLSGLGVEVIKCHDLEEGFWTCFTEKPHAVIIQLAKESEKLLEILDRFVVHPFTKKIPVIFINHENAIPTEDLPAGENFEVVNTPIAWHDFIAVLEKIVPISAPQKDDPLAKPKGPGFEIESVGEAVSGEAKEPAESSGEAVMQILCIDDDPLITQSVAIRMKPYGIEVLGVENGMGGYMRAVANRPDVILLDMQMPNGDGHYVLSKLKEHPRTKDIPIIMLTIESNHGVRRQMIGLGASGFLSKPVRWSDLFEELGNHVELPKKAVDDYHLKLESMASVY
jgi:CheY-like chemotaxis protein